MMRYEVLDTQTGEWVTGTEEWRLSPDGVLRYQVHNYHEFWLELAEPRYQAVPIAPNDDGETVRRTLEHLAGEGEG